MWDYYNPVDVANQLKKNDDKATDATTSFVETAEQLYNLPLDKAATKIEEFSDTIDLLDKKLDNAIGSTAKNKLIKQQSDEEEKTLKAYKDARKEANKNLKSAGKQMTKSGTLKSSDVSSKEKKLIKNAVKNGNEVNLSYFKEGSKAYNAAVKYNEALKARAKATYDAKVAQQEYNKWLVEASKLKFDNIADDYEKKVKMLDYQVKSIDNRISEIETAGKNVNRSYYDTQKKINAQKLEEYKQEKAALEESLVGIKQGTDEWYDAYDQIQQVSSAISDCVKETYNLNNAINQLHFDLFDDVSDSIKRIITEQEFLQGLFAHEKTTDDKTGNFTEAGIAKMGSLSASYYAADSNVKRAAAELKELQRMWDSKELHSDLLDIPLNSFDDLKKKIIEVGSELQDFTNERYSIGTKIYDLMKERYQAELDLLNDLIDKKKEVLQSEKDLHDYKKTINEKTNNIATIQKQIAAYSGDSSSEAMAKLQKLQKELDTKVDDLRETEYDRYISDQEDMLNKLYTEYEELITKKLEDFKGLVQEGLETANSNLSSIKEYLSQTASSNGYTEETKGLFDATTGGIKGNVDGIITTIEGKATANSGVVSDTAGGNTSNGGTSVGTNGGNNTNGTAIDLLLGASKDTLPKGGIITPEGGKDTSADKIKKANQLTLARDFIAKNAEDTKKAQEEFGAVNRVIYDDQENVYKGKGKILSSANLKLLSKNLGITYDGVGKNKNLYKKLHKIGYKGFRKGGIARLVKDSGEDGLTLARNGEGFIAPEHVAQIQDLLKAVPVMNDLTKSLVKLPATSNLVPVRYNDINIDLGGITMYGVNDPKEFSKQLADSMQNDKKIQKLIRANSTDLLAGAGNLSVNKIRY